MKRYRAIIFGNSHWISFAAAVTGTWLGCQFMGVHLKPGQLNPLSAIVAIISGASMLRVLEPEYIRMLSQEGIDVGGDNRY